MKIKIIQNSDLEEDVVIQYRELTPSIEAAILRLKVIEIDAQERGVDVKVPIDNVLFFESEDDKVIAHTASKYYITKYKLYELENILPSYFIRTSKSTIVNTLDVSSVERNLGSSANLSFFNSNKIAYVSRLYSGTLKKKLEERGLK